MPSGGRQARAGLGDHHEALLRAVRPRWCRSGARTRRRVKLVRPSRHRSPFSRSCPPPVATSPSATRYPAIVCPVGALRLEQVAHPVDVAGDRGEVAVGLQGGSRRSDKSGEDPACCTMLAISASAPVRPLRAQGVHRVDRAAAGDIRRDLHRRAVDLVGQSAERAVRRCQARAGLGDHHEALLRAVRHRWCRSGARTRRRVKLVRPSVTSVAVQPKLPPPSPQPPAQRHPIPGNRLSGRRAGLEQVAHPVDVAGDRGEVAVGLQGGSRRSDESGEDSRLLHDAGDIGVGPVGGTSRRCPVRAFIALIERLPVTLAVICTAGLSISWISGAVRQPRAGLGDHHEALLRAVRHRRCRSGARTRRR